ncbi:MAG: hypothetical protein ACE5LU_00850 [Anaerolineae bacterium]
MRTGHLLSQFGPWLLVVASAAALAGLILTTPPSPLMRLVFLVLLFAGSFGLLLLLFRVYYGRRLPADTPRRDPRRPAREGLMLAGFVTLCAWLQMLRILTLTNALLLLGVLAFMEAFWISRIE